MTSHRFSACIACNLAYDDGRMQCTGCCVKQPYWNSQTVWRIYSSFTAYINVILRLHFSVSSMHSFRLRSFLSIGHKYDPITRIGFDEQEEQDEVTRSDRRPVPDLKWAQFTVKNAYIDLIYIFIHQKHGSNNKKGNKNEYYKGLQTHTKKQLAYINIANSDYLVFAREKLITAFLNQLAW